MRLKNSLLRQRKYRLDKERLLQCLPDNNNSLGRAGKSMMVVVSEAGKSMEVVVSEAHSPEYKL